MKSSETERGETKPSLSFFQQTVLPLARFYDSQAANGAANSLKRKRTVLALWGLFPCFCRRPTDLEAVFPGLAPLLVRAMNDVRYPELVVSQKLPSANAYLSTANLHVSFAFVLRLSFHQG